MCRRLQLLLAVCLLSTLLAVAQNHESVTETVGVGNAMDVVILGDSNTWIGGDDCDNPKGWNKWFVDIFKPQSCKSYARSGATWTNTVSTRPNTEENIAVLGNDNVIYNQILRLSAACQKGLQPTPHLIIIAAGTNDAWFVKKRPRVFSKTVEQVFAGGSLLDHNPNQVLSLAESVRYGCEKLNSLFPHAQIILLTPLQAIQPTQANLDKASDIIEQCGCRMGLKVIRQDRECCVRRADEMKMKRYTTDGAHTSEEGARINGTYLAKRIGELIQP